MKSATLITLGSFLVLTSGAIPSSAQDSNYPNRKALIVNNCPFVELRDLSFKNLYEDRANRFHMDLKWKNISPQAIVAFEIVVLKIRCI